MRVLWWGILYWRGDIGGGWLNVMVYKFNYFGFGEVIVARGVGIFVDDTPECCAEWVSVLHEDAFSAWSVVSDGGWWDHG